MTKRPSEALVLVAPSSLAEGSYQPRSVLDTQSEEFIALVESVREHGVVEPILAREREDGTLEIIAGHRRKAAAIRANMAVPVRVLAIGEVEAREVALLENMARKDLRPWDAAVGMQELRNTRKRESLPCSLQYLASRTGRSRSAVHRLLEIADGLPSDVTENVAGHEWRDLPESVLHRAAKAGSAEEKLWHIQTSLARRVSSRTPERRIRRKQRVVGERSLLLQKVELWLQSVTGRVSPDEAASVLPSVRQFLASLERIAAKVQTVRAK